MKLQEIQEIKRVANHVYPNNQSLRTKTNSEKIFKRTDLKGHGPTTSRPQSEF